MKSLQQFSKEREKYPSVVFFTPRCCSLLHISYTGQAMPARINKVLFKLLQAFA
jgi:hypothetical protein